MLSLKQTKSQPLTCSVKKRQQSIAQISSSKCGALEKSAISEALNFGFVNLDISVTEGSGQAGCVRLAGRCHSLPHGARVKAGLKAGLGQP